jgi:TPR repeat protein
MLFFVGGSTLCLAQGDNPHPAPSQKPPVAAPTTLAVTADGDYQWKVDGVSHGQIGAGDPAVIVNVTPGSHKITAESGNGRGSFDQTVTVLRGRSAPVKIALQRTAAQPSSPQPGTSPKSDTAASRPPQQQPRQNTAAIPADTKRQAIALYDQKRFAEAAPLYDQSCTAGDMDACNTLGNMYQHAQGVTRSYGKAVSLYTSACNAGYALGCSNLGMIHMTLTQGYAKALQYLTQACTGGAAQGCFNLGYMYQNGLGTAKDESHSAALYSNACDNGVANGCNSLGSLYYGGLGVPQDYSKAVPLFTRACDAGNDAACRNLAICYRDGLGAGRDTAKAKELFNKACSMGLQQACTAAGEL